MKSQPDIELVEGYVRRYSQPVQWVGWWSTLPDSEDREALGRVLFGEEAESLRDLTGSEMPEKVLRVVLTSQRLLEIVRKETAQFLDRLTEKLADPEHS